MAKHVLWEPSETVERMSHEFRCGLADLDDLEVEIRDLLDMLDGLHIAY